MDGVSGGTRPNRGGAFEKWTVRLLVPALLLVAIIAAISGFRDRPLVDWRAWFDGPERGTWRALTLDGEAAFAGKFLVTIADGEIVAGRDGCNYWNRGAIDERTGERIYTTTLALCRETREMAVYRALTHGDPHMALASEDRLVLTSGSCRGEFRRWTSADEDAERADEEAKMVAQHKSDQGRAQASQMPQPFSAVPPRPSAQVPPAPPTMPPMPPPPPPEQPRVSPGC